MVDRIKAVATYYPRIKLGSPVSVEQFRADVVQRSALGRGIITGVQQTEMEILINALLQGRPVHTSTAIFTPCIDLKGRFSVNVSVHPHILQILNTPGAFVGELCNTRNTAMAPADFVDGA